MPNNVRLRPEIRREMIEEARRHPNQECCGLLAGSDGVITTILPAANSLASPVAYEIAPKELFRLVRAIRSDGMEMLGIYHSHPRGENRPSATDINRAYYPDTVYFIISPIADSRKPVRAFLIQDGGYKEIEIEIAPDSGL